MRRAERVPFHLLNAREGASVRLEAFLISEKGSASGSRSVVRRTRRRALNALSEGHMPLSRVEPRMNSSLSREGSAAVFCLCRKYRGLF